MRLLLVELRRLRSRRAVLVLLVACVLIPTAVFATTAWNTRPNSPEEREAFEEQVAIERQDPARVLEYERCLRNPDRYGIPENAKLEKQCDLLILPQDEWFGSRPTLDLQGELTGSGVGVIAMLAVMFILAGTTFAGHDWNSGSMSNQLLFEPRRFRVWLAKGLAITLAGLLVGAAVLAAYWAGLWFLADHRDLAPPIGLYDDIRATAIRGLLFAAAAGLGGYALTMLFRSTVATLGILFALSTLTPLMLALVGFDGYERWMPNVNFSAIIHDGATYFDQSLTEDCGPDDFSCGQVTLSLLGGATYYGAMVMVAVLLSVLSFKRRDVP